MHLLILSFANTPTRHIHAICLVKNASEDHSIDELVGVVAGYKMACDEFVLERGSNLLTNVGYVGTARMEPASTGGIDRTRDFAWQDNSCRLVLDIGHGNG